MARDTRLGRIVAVKRWKGPHSARFEKEARAIAALNHPHICQAVSLFERTRNLKRQPHRFFRELTHYRRRTFLGWGSAPNPEI